MCGRFTLRTPHAEVLEFTGAVADFTWEPRYNIAPSEDVPCLRLDHAGGRRLGLLRWGLIPFWADDPKIGYRTINARAESLESKPAFREAARRRRCLVVADGFYEWQKLGPGPKQPYYVQLADGSPFAFAGLWERWRPKDGDTLESCTIVTTEPNELLEPLHDRMPAILAPDAWDIWLDREADLGEVLGLLQPYAADRMTAYPVSMHVNRADNDDPRCIEPLGSAWPELPRRQP